MNGIYLTQEGKQEIEAKIAKLETGLKTLSLSNGFKDMGMLSVYEEILSSATILPVEQHQENSNISDVSESNSNKIRLEKLDVMGSVVETIELEGRWKITTGEKSYFMTNKYVDEIKVDLEKIQKNFMDNL